MGREVKLNARITSTEGLRAWAKEAEAGQWCIYHEGNLGRDRLESPDLHERAQMLMILSDREFVNLALGRPPYADPGVLCYMATRTGRGHAPRALLAGTITAAQFNALMAVLQREVQQSASRAIRERMAVSDSAAVKMLRGLSEAGFVEQMPLKGGWALTDEGSRALT